MGEQVVLEWLADWAALDPAELHSFAAEHDQSQDVVEAIYTVLDERTKHPEVTRHSFYGCTTKGIHIIKMYVLLLMKGTIIKDSKMISIFYQYTTVNGKKWTRLSKISDLCSLQLLFYK